MNELRRVDVAYTQGHWFADIRNVDAPIDRSSLRELIIAVQHAQPDEALLFIVDQSTIDHHIEAAREFLYVEKNEGPTLIISSVQEF